MKRTSRVREMWLDRVRRWMASGKSADDFATQEGCRPKALMVWRWQLGLGPRRNEKRLPAVAKQSAPRFVELLSPQLVGEIAKPAPISSRQMALPFEVTMPSGARVVVPPQFDRQALGALLELMGSR